MKLYLSFFQLPIALPVFLLLASLVILALTVYQKPTESGLGLLMMALGAPLYFVFVYWENKPDSIRSTLCKYPVLNFETLTLKIDELFTIVSLAEW